MALGEPSVGFRELTCDLAVDAASSFVRQSRLMHKWGMGPVSDEKLPQVVESEGQRVCAAQQQQSFALDWQSRRGAGAAPHIDTIMTLEALEVNEESQAYWHTHFQPPPRQAAA